MRFVTVLLLTLATPVPPENIEAARQTVERTAQAFYGRWGISAAEDAQLARQLMTPTFAADALRRRAACASGACADPLTCMVGRAAVTKATVAAGSTSSRFKVDVHLSGPRSASAVAQWVLDVAQTGTRLSSVTCAPQTVATPAVPAGNSGVVAPPPEVRAGSSTGLTIARAPVTEMEHLAVRFLQRAIAAGNDSRKLGELVSHFTRDNRDDYIEKEKECLEAARNGDPMKVQCAGNGLTCGAEEGGTLFRFHQDDSRIDVELRMPDGSTRMLQLDAAGGNVFGWRCYDSTPRATTAPSGDAISSTSTFDPGQCTGFATCSGSCTQTGCYVGRFGTCMGSPVPCSGRSRGMCNSPCYWTQ